MSDLLEQPRRSPRQGLERDPVPDPSASKRRRQSPTEAPDPPSRDGNAILRVRWMAPNERPIYVLTEGEQLVARTLGAERQRLNELEKRRDDLRTPGGDPVAIHTQAIGAEIAFARIVNVCPDLNIVPQPFDCRWAQVRVDVKSTTHENGHCIIHVWKVGRDLADLYVLLTGTFPRYRLVGSIPCREAHQPRFLKNFGTGDCYAIPVSALSLWPNGLIPVACPLPEEKPR